MSCILLKTLGILNVMFYFLRFILASKIEKSSWRFIGCFGTNIVSNIGFGWCLTLDLPASDMPSLLLGGGGADRISFAGGGWEDFGHFCQDIP